MKLYIGGLCQGQEALARRENPGAALLTEFHAVIREKLAAAYPQAELHTLSMGMSHDFEAAILEGSTLIRVGSAIFGPRNRL